MHEPWRFYRIGTWELGDSLMSGVTHRCTASELGGSVCMSITECCFGAEDKIGFDVDGAIWTLTMVGELSLDGH